MTKTKSVPSTSWLQIQVEPAIRWKMSLHKRNCLYFNASAGMHVVSKMLEGISIKEDGGELYLTEGKKHVTYGPREVKVYSKEFCDLIGEKYPGVREFALLKIEDRYLLKPLQD